MELACGWPGLGIYFSQSEKDLRNFMTKDWVATASDGSALTPFFGRLTHPRSMGTFPRKIRRYVVEERTLSLAEALRSMTELPAAAFQIPDRGRLEPGYYADVAVFAVERLRDRSTYDHSGLYSEGIDYLLVNGVPSIDGGRYNGKRAGRGLRLSRRAAQQDAAGDVAQGVPIDLW